MAASLKKIDEKIEKETKNSDKHDIDEQYLLQVRILMELL